MFPSRALQRPRVAACPVLRQNGNLLTLADAALRFSCVFSHAADSLRSQINFAQLERPIKNGVVFCRDIFKLKPPKT